MGVVYRVDIEDLGGSWVEIAWGEGASTTGQRAEIPDPVPAEVRGWIESYLAGFEPWREEGAEDAARAEAAMIEVGRALGASLASIPGLAPFLAQIQRDGAPLRVSVGSSRPAFHARPWELLILPGAKHLASASGAGVVRALPGPVSLARVALSCGHEAPLRVLRWGPSPAFGWTHRRWGGAVEDVADGAAHVVVARLPAEPPDAFARRVQRLGARAVVLAPAPGSAFVGEAVATVAMACLRAGISNVVADVAPRAAGTPDLLDELVEGLAGGLTLGQSVIEARKRRQRAFVDGAGASRKPTSLQTWAAVQHWSTADLQVFAQPLRSLEPAEAWRGVASRIFGFGGSSGPPPNHAPAAEGLGAALAGGAIPVLVGPRGSGRTTALRQVAAGGRFEAAFRWSFRDERYTVDDMLQMIEGALGGDAPSATEAGVLARARLLLLVDDADGIEADVRAFLERVDGTHGSRVVMAAEAPLGFGVVVPMAPLARGARRVLAYETDPTCLDRELDLDATAGNPFLVRQAARGRRGDGTAPDPVTAFYDSRWRGLAAPHQRLLRMHADRPGLTLGLFLVGADAPGGQPTDEGRALWAALGGEGPYRDALRAWEDAAFVEEMRVAPAALAFLQAASAPADPAAGLAVARVACAGLLAVGPRLARAPDHPVYLEIVANRAAVGACVAQVWAAGERGLAARAVGALDGLLGAAGLRADLASWALHLAEGAPVGEGAEDVLAWIAVAARAMGDPRAAEGLAAGVDALWARLDALPFGPVAVFLQRAFEGRGDHARLRALAERALATGVDAAGQLRWRVALVLAEGGLGDPDRIRRAEDDVAQIPADGLPDGIFAGIPSDLAALALRRGDLVAAARWLDEARARGGTTDVLDAELALARGDRREAAVRFCRLWKTATSGKQQLDFPHLARRLGELEEALGASFSPLYDAEAGDAPTPAALGFRR